MEAPDRFGRKKLPKRLKDFRVSIEKVHRYSLTNGAVDKEHLEYMAICVFLNEGNPVLKIPLRPALLITGAVALLGTAYLILK